MGTVLGIMGMYVTDRHGIKLSVRFFKVVSSSNTNVLLCTVSKLFLTTIQKIVNENVSDEKTARSQEEACKILIASLMQRT